MITSIIQHIKLLFCEISEREFFFKLKHLLGFTPHSLFYYQKAFTHKSANNIVNGTRICNERLEYLGDTILDSIIADYLFHLYPTQSEGFLTKMKSRVVNRKSLNDIAVTLHLEAFILCNLPHVQSNDAMGNAFEALVGAIYLDRGYDFTKKYIIHTILSKQFDFKYLERVDENYKSQLLEIVQKNRQTIHFETIISTAHAQPFFISTLYIDAAAIAQGEGLTKKDAEQQAAQRAIGQIT